MKDEIQPAEPEQIQFRLFGEAHLPTLIYLPGLHGDWTLVGSFRRALRGRLRFGEFTYPRTLNWTLDQYAAAVAETLHRHQLERCWILAESFGSQVAWPLVARGDLAAQGLILAGGFVRHPARWAVRIAEKYSGEISLGVITTILFGYARLARFRYHQSPEVLANINEFIARRTELDRQAAKHRLHLIAGSDFAQTARNVCIPVYALSGLVDPIVPWFWVRRWLKRRCAMLKDYRIVWRADHNVLGTAPEAAAEQIINWITAPPGR